MLYKELWQFKILNPKNVIQYD